jgi:hypothetical protein
MARRDFQLPAGDAQFLDSTGLAWETVVEGGARWLILRDRPVPPGYTAASAHVALLISPGYPDTEIDMAYFDPPLARIDGRPVAALAQHTLQGRSWQRWSRHRTPQNPWRPGIDDVAGHLLLVDAWLRDEIGRPT